MGADGGIAYAEMFADIDRINWLLQPFDLLGASKCSDVGEDASSLYIREHDRELSNCIVTYYGTDCCDNQGLRHLCNICDSLNDLVELGLHDAQDVIMDFETGPDWSTQMLLSRNLAYRRLLANKGSLKEEFIQLLFVDWLEEIGRSVGPIQVVQTWT